MNKAQQRKEQLIQNVNSARQKLFAEIRQYKCFCGYQYSFDDIIAEINERNYKKVDKLIEHIKNEHYVFLGKHKLCEKNYVFHMSHIECIECGERTVNKKSKSGLCDKCLEKKYIETHTRICKSCGNPFQVKTTSSTMYFCDDCIINNKALQYIINNDHMFEKLIDIEWENYNYYFLKKIFDIYYNKHNYRQGTYEYELALINNYEKINKIYKCLRSELAKALKEAYDKKIFTLEECKKIIHEMFHIAEYNLLDNVINEIKDNTLYKHPELLNYQIINKTQMSDKMFNFIINFLANVKVQDKTGKGEFLRCLLDNNILPQTSKHGDIFNDLGNCSELKFADISSPGSLIYDRSNFLTHRRRQR